MESKTQRSISGMLIEFRDAIEHTRAQQVLKIAKEQEAQKDLVSIKIDKLTTVLMSRDKAIKKGLLKQ